MRRILLALAILCSIAVAVPAAPAQASTTRAAQLADVTGVHMLVNARYNECLVTVGGSAANSNPIGHYPCDASPVEWNQWFIDYEARVTFCFASDNGNCIDRRTRDIYRLRNYFTGKCIEPHNGGKSSGTKIDQFDCRSGTYRQSWILVPAQNGGYFFYNAKVFDEDHRERGIDAPPFAQDFQVRLWTANQTDAQIWYIR